MRIIINADEESVDTVLTTIAELLSTRLDGIEASLDAIINQNKTEKRRDEKMHAETTALLERIDAASTELAADIQALIDRATTEGSLTAAEINAALAPKVAFLEALASNTTTPVPPVPPPAEPTSTP